MKVSKIIIGLMASALITSSFAADVKPDQEKQLQSNGDAKSDNKECHCHKHYKHHKHLEDMNSDQKSTTNM